MKLLWGIKSIEAFSKGTVVTIGNFDGVHSGHQSLLRTLKNKAVEMQLPMVVVLFEPQPFEFFSNTLLGLRLSTLREKMHILASCGVDYVCCLRFNDALGQMSAEIFAKNVLFNQLNCHYLLIGEDFRFGQGRRGDVQQLRIFAEQSSSVLEVFPTYDFSDRRVSSTRIRELLGLGNLQEAAVLLGRPYGLCGRVVAGSGRGRQWGIPTANVARNKALAPPLRGVFCVSVRRENGSMYAGVANVGNRPTVDGTQQVLEIHLFETNESLYGERIYVYFFHKLRDEIKFQSVDALIAQIHDDIAQAKKYGASKCTKNITSICS